MTDGKRPPSPVPAGEILSYPVRLGDLIASIQDHLDYQGLDAVIEKVDDNKLLITIPEE